MKLRIDSQDGKWRVFLEEAPGIYRELNPMSCGFAHIDIDTEPPKDGIFLAFVSNSEAPNAQLEPRAE